MNSPFAMHLEFERISASGREAVSATQKRRTVIGQLTPGRILGDQWLPGHGHAP